MNSNEELIEHLEAVGVLKSSQLKAALLTFPREYFVPAELRPAAYEDRPLPIGEGQTISQPYTVVFMLEELGVEAGDKVLEIGAGSGWQTALLSYLVSNTAPLAPHPYPSPKGEGTLGHVWAYEIREDVAKFGRGNLYQLKRDARRFGGPSLQNVDYIAGDAIKHASAHAPYNRIIAGAAFGDAVETQPVSSLLTIGGRMVVPTMNNDIRVVERVGENKFKEKIHYGFVFVPVVH